MARKRRRRNPIFAYLLYAAILAALCLLYWALTSYRLARGVPADGPVSAADRGAAAVRPATIRAPSRAIYPHSVIRGGAYSAAELEAAMRADPVVAAHYADFNPSQMRIAQAPDAAVYVSYRQGDRVYWTRRKVHVAAQETLLTDGVHTARARCGNRISLTAQEPVQAAEPSDRDLDQPERAPTAYAGDPATALPDVYFLPVVVHEIFPDLLANWLPGGSAGSHAPDEGPGGGMPFWGLLEETALLPGYTLPTVFTRPLPRPVVAPGELQTLPPPPAGPGFLWTPPVPLPGGYGTGSSSGQPPSGTAPAPPAVWGLSLVPGLSTAPTAVWGLSLIPGVPGNPPPPFTRSGTSLPPTPGSGPPLGVLLPPTAPIAADPGIPEPATAALLLCGAVILACRRLSRRRLD